MRVLSLVTSILILCSCSTPRTTEARRQTTLDAVAKGDFITATKTIDKIYGGSGGEEPRKEKHKLLWYMQQGKLAAMQKDYKRAEALLLRAGEIVNERRGVNVGGAVGSAMANETVRAYAGEGFEHIHIDVVRALNYIEQAQILAGLHKPAVPPLVDTDGKLRGPNVIDGRITSQKHYERARIVTKRLNLDQLEETEFEAGSRRYDKDPFGNLLAGAVVLAMPKLRSADRQYAEVMFHRALEAYAEDIQDFGSDGNFEFELGSVPKFVETLQARNGIRYNPKKYEAKKSLDWKPGQGSILIVQMHGFIARPKTLDIRLITAVGSKPATGRQFRIGGVAFYADGPGADVVNNWTDILLPGDVVDELFGSGLAIMGFAMPVHEKDQPVAEPAQVTVASADGAVNIHAQTEVVSDLDAYARATLKDEQPALFVKTFARATAKQVAAHVAAQQLAEEDPVAGFFGRLVGSSIATATEVADTRAWWLMPNYISATLIDLPAGEYHVQLDHSGGNVDLGQVTVKEHQLIILPARTLGK